MQVVTAASHFFNRSRINLIILHPHDGGGGEDDDDDDGGGDGKSVMLL